METTMPVDGLWQHDDASFHSSHAFQPPSTWTLDSKLSSTTQGLQKFKHNVKLCLDTPFD